MALRFLADCASRNSTVQTLREANYEVFRLRDVLPVESTDAIVLAKAQEIDAVLISLDGDFADIINYPPKDFKGIIVLQMRNHPEILPRLLGRLRAYLKSQPAMEHCRGKLILVEADRIRVRQ